MLANGCLCKAETFRYGVRSIIERACTLLRETDRSINDISGNVGFDSPNHLKAAFKKAFGQTMSDYRKRRTSARSS